MRSNSTIDNYVSYTADDTIRYPSTPPYNPGEDYAEYNGPIDKEPNTVYSAVRDNFRKLGLDKNNYGLPTWNPLKDIVHKCDTVLIKPNFVLHENMSGESIWAIITHPSVIRVVIDYVYLALQGTGRIIIADAPQSDCDFTRVLELTRLDTIQSFYQREHHYPIQICDLRQLRVKYNQGYIFKDAREVLSGDPEGYCIFNMGKNSCLSNIENPEKVYGADYDRTETLTHHSEGRHEYCVSRSILNANVIISIPKMKTHRKSGVTLNMKNFIGINGNKNYLPHFRIGDPTDGGDEYGVLEAKDRIVKYTNRKLIDRLLVNPNPVKEMLYKALHTGYKLIKRKKRADSAGNVNLGGGAWYGNDTLWRTIIDLNRIVLFGNTSGELETDKQRGVFSIIDGVVAGEAEGPLSSKEKACGILIAGYNHCLTDLVAIKLMGVDCNKVPLYRNMLEKNLCNIQTALSQLQVITDEGIIYRSYEEMPNKYSFEEPSGWKNKLLL